MFLSHPETIHLIVMFDRSFACSITILLSINSLIYHDIKKGQAHVALP